MKAKAVKKLVKKEIRKVTANRGSKKAYEISYLFNVFLNPNKWIDVTEPIADHYVVHGSLAPTLAADLNDRGPFRVDGVIFQPTTFQGVKKISDVNLKIQKRYKKAGWTVLE